MRPVWMAAIVGGVLCLGMVIAAPTFGFGAAAQSVSSNEVDYCGVGQGVVGQVSPQDHLHADEPSLVVGPLSQLVEPLTTGGSYMPRTHCMVKADGNPDWPWIFGLIGVTLGIIAAYLRIYTFWRRCYLAEAIEDRNPKMMQLANVFFWCAICGYVFSILMFVWPAYRLLAVFLFVLNLWSWRFIRGIGDFRIALQAKRLQRELAESLAERNAELLGMVAARTSELEAARAASESANLAKSAFLANMSHEIRTPLTAILGFSDMLREELPEDGPHFEKVQTIRRNGDHLIRLINDVLDISKIEAGRFTLEKIPVCVSSVVKDMKAIMDGRAQEKSIELDLVFETTMPEMVITDPTRLRQILLNLVGNALKFTESGGVTIAVSFERTDEVGQIRIEVRDTGVGISEEQLEGIFQPFVQADESTTRRFGGSGLGLAISRRLAEMLGGRIEVQSTLGEGSCFTLALDVSAADLKYVNMIDGEVVCSRSMSASASKAPHLSGRVMLVEDSPDILRLISLHLRRFGLDVVEAVNGQEAIKQVLGANGETKTTFDLIFMDIQMPMMDGLEATAHLRQSGYTGPIVALTANAMQKDRERCTAAGFNDFAIKPIDVGELHARCDRWITYAKWQADQAAA